MPLSIINIDNIKSNFRKKCVLRDFNKTLLDDLKNKDFDVLLMDFIDERFNLYKDEQGRIITVSSELLESGFNLLKSNIPSGDDIYFSLFCESWKKFMDFCNIHQILDKIMINEVYYCEDLENYADKKEYYLEIINKNNILLNKIYNEVHKYIPNNQFITYPTELLKSNPNHQWGLAPFHYVDDVYEFCINHLKYFTYNVTFEYKNGRFFVCMDNKIHNDNSLYAFYLIKDNNVYSKIWYNCSNNATFCVDVFLGGVYKCMVFIKDKKNFLKEPIIIYSNEIQL